MIYGIQFVRFVDGETYPGVLQKYEMQSPNLGCVFHAIVGTDSTGWWAVIPLHRGRLSAEAMMEARPTV